MKVNLKWVSAQIGAQVVSHEIKTVGDLRGLARKIDKLVRDTDRVIPGVSKSNVQAVSLGKD